jgi:hypothetical protein
MGEKCETENFTLKYAKSLLKRLTFGNYFATAGFGSFFK